MNDGWREIGEWFKMSRPQRIAAIVLVALIMGVTAIQVSLSRSEPMPAELEKRAAEMGAFREAADSAAIDTVKPSPRKRQSSKQTADRKMEQIPTFDPA